jgi:hypothetical protein
LCLIFIGEYYYCIYTETKTLYEHVNNDNRTYPL